MAEPTKKAEEIEMLLDAISVPMSGLTRLNAIRNGQCATCGEAANEFRNELSEREYNISGMCQACQDDIFGVD